MRNGMVQSACLGPRQRFLISWLSACGDPPPPCQIRVSLSLPLLLLSQKVGSVPFRHVGQVALPRSLSSLPACFVSTIYSCRGCVSRWLATLKALPSSKRKTMMLRRGHRIEAGMREAPLLLRRDVVHTTPHWSDCHFAKHATAPCRTPASRAWYSAASKSLSPDHQNSPELEKPFWPVEIAQCMRMPCEYLGRAYVRD